MPNVGDRVRVESRKLGQAVREGVVTEVLGHLLRVRWSTGEESTFTPGPGSVTVVGRTRVIATKKAPSKKAAAASSKKGAKVGNKKTTTRAVANKNAAPKKAR
jgi:Domain of unknown function (DUF1918)